MLSRSKLISLFFLFSITSQQVFSQASLADSSIKLSTISVNYTIMMPAADMADRYGISSGFGLSYTFKTKTNWLFDAEYKLLVSADVKEKHLFDQIITSSGYMINEIGLMQPLGMELRGHIFNFDAGKIIYRIGQNDNSGLFVKAGAGFLRHKILFVWERSRIGLPQLEGNYAKGYDRLSSGMLLSQKIGYQHFSNSNLGSVHVSFYLIEGFTQSRRSWNFDQMQYDATKRLDLLFGLEFGLDIPIYARVPDKYYIY